MLKYIHRITARYSPLDSKSRSLKASLLQINTRKNKQQQSSNAFLLQIQPVDGTTKPWMEVEYTDKKVLRLDTAAMSAEEIVGDIKRHSKKLALLDDIKSSV